MPPLIATARNLLDRLFAALQFLTLLPLGRTAVYDPIGMIALFPVAGLLVGVMLSMGDTAARLLWPAQLAALLDVLLLAVLTGALHLDGLADTADGLLGHHPRERALEIMKDSRVGAMGLVAVCFGLALKWGGIYALGEQRTLILMIVPALARGAMLLAIRQLPYGRPAGGTGQALFATRLPWSAFWALSIPALLCLLLGWRGPLVLGGAVALSALLVAYYRRRIGCVTGDMLGAMTEILESGLFLLAAAGGH